MRTTLKLALKILLRRKFFTAVSLLGIVLTLTVLTVSVALLDHVFAPQPPETRLDRTLGIWMLALEGEHWRRTGFAGWAFLDRYARDLPGVEVMTVFSLPATGLSFVDGAKVRSFVKRTDGAFWRALDFEFVEGGPYSDAEAEAGSLVAVINETSRARLLGGGPAVGRTVEVDGQRFRVVGVVPDVPIVRLASFADVWVPLATQRSDSWRQEIVGGLAALLVAHDKADFPQIQAEVERRIATVQLPDPAHFQRLRGGADTHFEALSRALFDDYAQRRSGRLAGILALAAFAFMLLPALNLVNLNLSRILERASEIGVRKAFGASSWALVGQFLVENLVLTLIGGLVAFAVSAGILAAVNASGLIPYAELAVNHRVFAAGLGLALVFGVLSGVVPAWRMSRLAPAMALQGAAGRT